MADPVLMDIDDHVALITVNDPERRNAVTAEISAGLRAAVERGRAEPDVHALIVTGAGKAFCAGADLSRSRRGDRGRPARRSTTASSRSPTARCPRSRPSTARRSVPGSISRWPPTSGSPARRQCSTRASRSSASIPAAVRHGCCSAPSACRRPGRRCCSGCASTPRPQCDTGWRSRSPTIRSPRPGTGRRARRRTARRRARHQGLHAGHRQPRHDRHRPAPHRRRHRAETASRVDLSPEFAQRLAAAKRK